MTKRVIKLVKDIIKNDKDYKITLACSHSWKLPYFPGKVTLSLGARVFCPFCTDLYKRSKNGL